MANDVTRPATSSRLHRLTPGLGALLLILVWASGGEAVVGDLTQFFPCVAKGSSEPACESGVGLGQATGVAVSPDGKHVYVASQNSNAVAVFTRNKTTGAV
jgi:DNA-binding beta-propeller fold protein YncE